VKTRWRLSLVSYYILKPQMLSQQSIRQERERTKVLLPFYRQWASPTDSQRGTYIKGEFVITLPSLILNVLVKTQISTSNRESHCLIHDTILILDYCNTLSYYRPFIQYENLVYLYFLHSHIMVLYVLIFSLTPWNPFILDE